MPATTARSAGASAPSPARTGAAGRAARAWASGAGRSSGATRGRWRTGVRPCVRYDRLGVIVRALLQAACLFLVAGRLARES